MFRQQNLFPKSGKIEFPSPTCGRGVGERGKRDALSRPFGPPSPASGRGERLSNLCEATREQFFLPNNFEMDSID
jgi:hypothetical protein